MQKTRRSFCLIMAGVPFVTLTGCGGGADTDVSNPVEVTDELERQAKASDEFFDQQSAKKEPDSN